MGKPKARQLLLMRFTSMTWESLLLGKNQQASLKDRLYYAGSIVTTLFGYGFILTRTVPPSADQSHDTGTTKM